MTLRRCLPAVSGLFFLSLFCFQSPARAVASDETAPLGYENLYTRRIAVSPLRAPQTLNRLSENVTVIDGDTLAGLPVRDPAEALAAAGGVDVSLRTRFGHLTPLSVQGSTSRHVLVLVDGIPFNTQASGQADILAQLPFENLDRIEVVKGAASAAWGQALGGVVHLVTREPSAEPFSGSFTGAWAEFDAHAESFAASGTLSGTGYVMSGEHRETGGARTHGGTPNRDDTLQRKFSGKLVRPLSETAKASAQFGVIDSEINEGVYPSNGMRSQVPYYARYGQARIEFENGAQTFEAAAKFNRQLIQSEFFSGTTDVRLSRTRTRDNYYGGELKYTAKPRGEDLFVAGYDVSNYILETTLMNVSKDVWLHAPYANYTLVLEPFDFKLGARADFNDEYGDQFNPSAGVVFHVPGVKETLLRANVSRAFSAPPLLWKYFENAAPGFTANNPDLKPERAWVYEAGLETAAIDRFWFKLGLFYSDIRDAVNTDVNAAGLFFKRNFERFRQQGVELESRYRVCPTTELSFGASFTDVEDQITGLPARNRGATRPAYRAGVDYRGPYGIRAFLGGRYDRFDSPASAQPNDRKFVFDGRISRKWENLVNGLDLTCFLNAYNLTNSKYWSDRDFPLPERYFEGGVTVEF